MTFLSTLKKSFQKVEETMHFLFRLLFNKKFLIFGLCSLFYLRIRYFPIEINTSDFLKFIELSAIRSLCTLGNRLVLFKDNKENNFLCNYYVQDSDKFNNMLM